MGCSGRRAKTRSAPCGGRTEKPGNSYRLTGSLIGFSTRCTLREGMHPNPTHNATANTRPNALTTPILFVLLGLSPAGVADPSRSARQTENETERYCRPTI